ncbi:hypothetical protein ACEPAI_3956 [Sanghuangporus weigelae]
MMFASNWLPFNLKPMLSDLSFGDAESHGKISSFAVAGICVALASLVQYVKTKKPTVDVPVEGSSGVVSSYIHAYEFIRNAKSILGDAYNKYGRGTFKIPGVERYTVILNRRDLIEEIRKAPDEKVSFTEASAELFVSKWTFGERIMKDHYHIHIVRNQLTRSLTSLFDDVRDEIEHAFNDIEHAFNDLIPAATEDEWIAIPALDTIRNVVCRASNRIFVGLPLCRDPDYIDLNITYTIDVMKTVYTIIRVPEILRPVVGPIVSTSPRSIRRGMKLLRPALEERFRLYEENGDDWSEKPVDMISWLLDDAPEIERRNVRELTKRMLVINFAAIHTSSNSFTHALFHLAAEPKYIVPIREEVERVINENGWSKVAMTKMWKLDSFMKESQRMNGINLVTLNRKVMSDFTLSDGTFLPAGTFLNANLTGAHYDGANYPNPDKFDGFRFSKMRDENAEESVKHQMVNTSADYLAFGHGRHACPGRFFAVNELKAMMAYLIMNYDIKAEVEEVRPENVYHATRVSPHPKAKVLLSKRARA